MVNYYNLTHVHEQFTTLMASETLHPVVSTLPKTSRGCSVPECVWLSAGALVLLVSHLPLLAAYAGQLWLREHYQFFPWVIAGILYLSVLRLREVKERTPGNRILSGALAVVSWSLLLTATLLQSPWLGMAAALSTTTALLYALGNWRLVRTFSGPLSLLLLIFYPPFGLDYWLITRLQILASQWASKSLDVFGVVHVAAGTVVQVPGQRLLVEEACSGVNSLFSILAITVFYLFCMRRRWLLVVMLPLAVFWVVAVNVFRVFALTYCHVHWDVDLLEGWPHTVFGLSLFVICLGLVLSSERLLLFLTESGSYLWQRGAAEDNAAASGTTTNVGASEMQPVHGPPRRMWMTAPLPLAAFLALGGFQIYNEWVTAAPPPAFVITSPLPVDTEALPAKAAEWERVGEVELVTRDGGGVYGDFSHMWNYRRGKLRARVSLDYAYTGWHELANCYRLTGWTLNERTSLSKSSAKGPPYVELDLQKPLAAHGYVYYSLIDARGNWLVNSTPETLEAQFHQRFVNMRTPYPSYQIQVYLESPLPLTETEKQAALKLFRTTRSRLAAELSRLGKIENQ